MSAQVITWCDGNGGWGVVGVFDDSDMAIAVFDALKKFGGGSRQYYLDDYKLNEVKA